MSKYPPDSPRKRVGLRARISDPRLISWSTFLVSSVLLSYEIWLHGWLAFAGAQVMVFALLFIARALYLSRSYPSRHAWVMLSTIVMASLFGAVLAQVVFSEPDTLVTVDGAFTRMFVIPASGLLSISLIDYRNNVRDLRATAAQLETTRDAGLQSLSESRHEIVNRVREKLEGAISDLRGQDQRTLATDLAALAQETVRPLSHELARSTPEFAPAQATTPRLRWSAVLSEVASRPLMVPWLMALAVAVMSIRFTFEQSDVAVGSTLVSVGPLTLSMDGGAVTTSLTFLFVVFCAVWLLSAAAARITRPILTTATGGVRWLVIAVSVISIGVGLQIVLIVLPVLPGPLSTIDTDPVGRFWAFAPVVLIALVLAIARTVSFARASVIEDLTNVADELEWEVARIRLELWGQQRQFAHAIHGPLQAAITASALLLTESKGLDRTSAVEAAHDRIKSALDRLTDHTDTVIDWDTGIHEIQRTWEGVCAVSVDVDPQASLTLEQDDTCRQASVMVIGEAVANAAIHGKAARVDVTITAARSRFIEITIEDDGIGVDAAAASGLGSAILDEACGVWALTNTDEGARLSAVLASSPPISHMSATH